MINPAKNRQICNNFNVGISIILQICKKSANLQKIRKCAKYLQMHKISANSQKICKSAKQSAKKEISFVFRIDDYDHCKDPTRLPHK
jgi:hypothetical protein